LEKVSFWHNEEVRLRLHLLRLHLVAGVRLRN
jgi:hypothetical protein